MAQLFFIGLGPGRASRRGSAQTLRPAHCFERVKEKAVWGGSLAYDLQLRATWGSLRGNAHTFDNESDFGTDPLPGVE